MDYIAANTEDLETPLLLEMDEQQDKNNSEAKMIAEIHSAIPVDGAGVPIARNESCNNGKKDLVRMSTDVIVENPIIVWGFLLGAALQIWATAIILRGKSIHTATVIAAAATTDTANGSVIDLDSFSRFYLLVFLSVLNFYPLFVLAMFLRRRGRGCRRKTNKGGSRALGLYIKCAQFQIGILFGSLSIFPIYILFPTTPLLILLACNYAIWLVIWFFGLCLIQIIVNQIFANIADIENKKEDENEDEKEDDEYECPHNA